MLSTEDRAKLDKIWTCFSVVTGIDPLAVLDLINSLLFIKQLDQIEAEKGKISALSGEPVDHPIYSTDQQDLRWRSFHYLEAESLNELFSKRNGVIEFVKSIPEYSGIEKFYRGDQAFIPPPYLLGETVSFINQLNVPDDSIRTGMINYLLHKPNNATIISDPVLARPVHRIIHIAKEQDDRNSYRKIKPLKRTYQLFLLLFLIAFSITVFYINIEKPIATASNINNPVFTKTKEKDSLSPENQNVQVESEAKNKAIEIVKKSFPGNDTVVAVSNTANKSKVVQSTTEPNVAVIVAASANEARENEPKENNTNTETKEQYKILQKAYFHDKPDESTRRNAFVIHWNNSYAKLQALDEKNGFIYVVFRNHLNQTSKGWLRRKDLQPID